MNPFGFLIVGIGLIVGYIGLKGTQGALYSDVFGHPFQSATQSRNPNLPGGTPTTTGTIYRGNDGRAYMIGPDGLSHPLAPAGATGTG